MIVGEGLESKQLIKKFKFSKVVCTLDGSEKVSEASWGLSWKMLARRLRFSQDFWTCWQQDGEQEAGDGDQDGQDGDQERQDEPT